MGSGHFLREAFDMLAAMYRERRPDMAAREIAGRILRDHLYGIDIDPRAAQLAALTLHLRAAELIRDGESRNGPNNSSRKVLSLGITHYASRPTHHATFQMNLATTPTGLTPGALERHLERHPEDRIFKPLLEGIFAALEQADILGSLLRPGEHLDEAIGKLRKTQTLPLGVDGDDAALRRTIAELAKHDPAELKALLLDRVAQSFAAEAGEADVAAALFGREAGEGVRLLRLLDRRYAVVVTNPPYMGSKNMDAPLKNYVSRHYPSGKRDLYAAFILRCLELCRPHGRVAMVTQQSWMFLGSFSNLRESILSQSTLSSVAHLGTKTFRDLSNTNALGFVMFSMCYTPPSSDNTVVCFRAVHAEQKEHLLRQAVIDANSGSNTSIIFAVRNEVFRNIPGHVLFYWAPAGIAEAFLESSTLANFVEARQGLITGDNNRFLRFSWEVDDPGWKPYVKGGPYRRWYGNQELVVNWGDNGVRIKELRTPSGRQASRPQNVQYYFREGGTWTGQSSYGFSVRYLPPGFIFDAKGPSFFVQNEVVGIEAIISLANSNVIQFVFSAIQPTVDYGEGYFMSLPTPSQSTIDRSLLDSGRVAILIKQQQTKVILTERCFDTRLSHSSVMRNQVVEQQFHSQLMDALIHTVEGFNDYVACAGYGLSESDVNAIIGETGTPAGWHPLTAGYDTLPDLPADLDLPPLPQEVRDFLAAHERLHPSPEELARIKANLRALYEAGPGARADDLDLDDLEHHENDEDDEGAAGAHIPIPTETFLEELSVKLQVHPISVYWLLEELRAEGARCKPEERRLLEDRLSVLVLRLLGHRWPKQIEAGEPVPAWADRDGVIPLMPGSGETTVAERLRERLRAEEGALGVQRTEALLQELTGRTLEEWLRRDFFPRHVRQFKYRPIAWHLASRPETRRRGGRSGGGSPAFECLLSYRACTGDVLARIRTQYVEPLLRAERRRADDARRTNDETAAALATARIHELEAFAAKLREVEEEGFPCQELDDLLAKDPLDRWSGDGYLPPSSREALLHQERAWRVDINDGVRVNLAPLQLAGLLASDVLKAKDARQAIADRARWRADERRWVRKGRLPRCGWMDERVPESQRWTELAPEREAERARLQEKRKAVRERLGG